MCLVFTVLLASLSVCDAVFYINVKEDVRSEYRRWQNVYSKAGLRDSGTRYDQFKRSYNSVQALNKKVSWKAGLTLFADMSYSERSAYTGLNVSYYHQAARENIRASTDDLSAVLPESQYWEMGPVQDQGGCSSCWAFAAVATLEGLHLKHHSEYKEFSEQGMLDCTYKESDGCKGGDSIEAINWAGSVSGDGSHSYLPLRADLPYRGSDGTCNTGYWNGLKRARPVAATADGGFGRTDRGLELALATEGPVIVYIKASWALYFYQWGTFSGTGCGTNPEPNHAVTVAGYNKDAWYIKNSWGRLWGKGGYMYLSRSKENLCSVSRYRISVEWNSNQHWAQCQNVDPADRVQCAAESEEECRARGCCYDKARMDCFVKGKVTVFSRSNIQDNKRVLYGSIGDFTKIGLDKQVFTVTVQAGAWVAYTSDNYRKGETKVLSRGIQWDKPVKSLRLLSPDEPYEQSQ